MRVSDEVFRSKRKRIVHGTTLGMIRARIEAQWLPVVRQHLPCQRGASWWKLGESNYSCGVTSVACTRTAHMHPVSAFQEAAEAIGGLLQLYTLKSLLHKPNIYCFIDNKTF